jgi:transposase
VSDTLKRFEKRGLEGRYSIKQNGRPPKLTTRQKKQLERMLTKPPTEQKLPYVVWTTKLVQYIIKKRFGVKYVIRQIDNLMKALRFSIQKPRPEHIKANKQLQEQFKKNYDAELRDLLKQDMRSSFWTRASSR